MRAAFRDLLGRGLVILGLWAAPVGCVDRAAGDSASSDEVTSSSVPADAGLREEEEEDIVRRRCELFFTCDLHPGHLAGHDADQPGCEQYFASAFEDIRMNPEKSRECVPALLDYYACSNELTNCHALWVSRAFSENAAVCYEEKLRYCEAGCGCPYGAP